MHPGSLGHTETVVAVVLDRIVHPIVNVFSPFGERSYQVFKVCSRDRKIVIRIVRVAFFNDPSKCLR